MYIYIHDTTRSKAYGTVIEGLCMQLLLLLVFRFVHTLYKLYYIFFRNCYDMKNIHLDMRLALKKEHNGVVTWCDFTKDNVAPINNIGNSMIKSLHLYLNDVLINSSADNYHLKSYIQTLYTFDSQQKGSYLQPAGWFADSTRYFNDMGQAGAELGNNTGFIERKKLFLVPSNTRYAEYPIHILTKLSTDFLGTANGLLIPGVEVRIEIELNSPQIYLMSNTLLQGPEGDKKQYSYHLDLADIKIHVPVCAMSQESFLRFNSTLAEKPAIYDLKKTMIIPHPIPKGSSFYFNNCLFACAEQPARFGIAFVSTSAYKGKYE